MTEKFTVQSQVQNREINAQQAGQRIDNYLMTQLKGVPKSHVYRILRSGEVRVNRGRIKPGYRLQNGDIVRIPPIRTSEKSAPAIPPTVIDRIQQCLLYEDDNLLILNKPAGIAVHSGSGIPYGIIDILRHIHGADHYLELAHRLDRQTSGCLVIAKSRLALTRLQPLFKSDVDVNKHYLTLVAGHWPDGRVEVNLPLKKNTLKSGERMVMVDSEGKTAISVFTPTEYFESATLMDVHLRTGRTHQIRVHATHQGHPVAGDEKYGDKSFNKQMKKLGLKRMFLHARSIAFELDGPINVTAPLDENLKDIIEKLRNINE